MTTNREDQQMSTYPPETAAGLLKMREDWLKVITVPAQHGGFDVALVIDGSYDPAYYDATDLKRSWARRLMDALAADGLPLGVPLAECAGRAAVLGGEPVPALPAVPDFPDTTPETREETA
jgi:hypothetical protein